MNIKPSPVKLVRSFSDVQSDMSRMDGNLTQWENHGRTYPGSTVDDSFREMARDLDDATINLSQLHPERLELLGDLKRDTLDLGYNAGLTGSMYQHSTTFGSGWHDEMDPGIEDTRRAIDLLTAEPGDGAAEKEPPSPMKVMRQLSDVQADLTRWDANFTQWQDNGRIYPGSSVSKNVLKVAGKLYDARESMRAIHPEQAELLEQMQGDIINVAGDAGSTRHMYSHSHTFGSGWSESLDRPIDNVRRAIDIIAESAQ